jgi:geranylgeranyl diphosphate synthase, type II
VNTREYIESRRAEIDAALPTFLPATPDCPAMLSDAMRYSLLAGGKRLRPILCLAACDAVGGDRAMVMPTACALEMIHTYSLIHDDLPAMDNDTMRRGRPTLHVVAGEGQAILAGDGLLTLAFNLLAGPPWSNRFHAQSDTGAPRRIAPKPPAEAAADWEFMANKLDVIQIISSAAGPTGMVGGQAIDLACVTPDPQGVLEPPLDATGLERMHGKKTGAMIRASAASGAILGGGTEDQITAIDEAAGEFGLAFQIVDDVLDVEGASADLGKTAGKDAAAGKPTYPALYGLAASKRMAAECLERAAAHLAKVALADSHLLGIGRWIVERSN